jgi:type II secretory pathway predicted ATPase ExeA
MYEEFYGLTGKPFSLLPDGDMLFPSKRHRRAVNLLDYGVETQAGFVAISGEVGAGKTTVVRRFLKNVGRDITLGIVTNPGPATGRPMNWIAQAFDLKIPGDDAVALYNAFVEFMLAQYAQGRRTVLIIDEAQNLTADMLEELRMLSNVNNERDLLLQIVLVGQPEMLDLLKKPNLRQFVQRISVHCHLDPLSPAETAAYIRFRLAKVGGSPDLFDDLACAAVHRFSGGVPRLINLLCDQSLVYGFSEDAPHIELKTVVEVVTDRAQGGLSAYQNVPDNVSLPLLTMELRPLVDEIALAGKHADAEARA